MNKEGTYHHVNLEGAAVTWSSLYPVLLCSSVPTMHLALMLSIRQNCHVSSVYPSSLLKPVDKYLNRISHCPHVYNSIWYHSALQSPHSYRVWTVILIYNTFMTILSPGTHHLSPNLHKSPTEAFISTKIS